MLKPNLYAECVIQFPKSFVYGVSNWTTRYSHEEDGMYYIDYCLTSIYNNNFNPKIKEGTRFVNPKAFNNIKNYLPYVNGIKYGDTYLIEVENKNATSYNVKEGTKWIGENAFSGCTQLVNITLPSSINTIGKKAFANCSELTSVIIPDNVEYIDDRAFYRCTNAEIILNNNVKCIRDFAFYGCEEMKNIIIPEGCKYIGLEAFGSDGKYVDSFIIPKSVEYIGSFAFSGIYVKPSNFINNSDCTDEYNWGLYITNGDIINGFLIEDGVLTRWLDCSTATSAEIPEGVTSIEYKFPEYYDNMRFTSVTMPNSVVNIKQDAFSYCRYLENVSLSTSLQTIGDNAFKYCRSLSTIDIPNTIISIGENAFKGCYFDENFSQYSTLEGYPWGATLCDYRENGLAIKDNILLNGARCKGAVVIPDDVTTIKSYAFQENGKITSITIPSSVTSIGSDAFCYCPNLTEYIFLGTKAQWTAIIEKIKDDFFDSWPSSYQEIQCSDGKIDMRGGIEE